MNSKLKNIYNNKKLFSVITGILCGIIAFTLIYGIKAYDFTNDNWIMQGYDEADIRGHYIGWMAYRNSPWAFPLGRAEKLAGTIISFMDSIPYVSIICKIFLQITGYKGTFQFFGMYVLLCYCLQGVAAGLIVLRKTKNSFYIMLCQILFVFSPILMERAFRHTALASHFFILFAIYGYLKARDEGFVKYPLLHILLPVIAIGIHPYFLPLTLIFSFVMVVEGSIKTRRVAYFIGNFLLSLILTVTAGFLIGTLFSDINSERGGYGFYTLNLNAVINPVSTGQYRWSAFLKERPQIAGNYDGFNYLGVGILILFIVSLVYTAVKGKLLVVFKNNTIYILCMVFLALYAVTNHVMLDKSTILYIPLPEKITDILSIFRASSRMFYGVYYSIFIFCVYTVLKFFESEKVQVIILAAFVLLQLYDLNYVVREKHVQYAEKYNSACIFDDEYLSGRLKQYKYSVTDEPSVTSAAVSMKNNLHSRFCIGFTTMVENYTEETEISKKAIEDCKNGIHDKETVFITTDEDFKDELIKNNDDMEVYRYENRYFIMPVK